MNERTIQNSLWWNLSLKGHRWTAPNWTRAKWWEADMFSVTKAGFVSEYEIKLTMHDFRADALKSRDTGYRWALEQGVKKQIIEREKKHDLLASRDPRCPNRFYYVVPKDMLTAEQVPEWAGLIECWEYKRHVQVKGLPPTAVGFRTIKEAPRLHRVKLAEAEKIKLAEMFYWRYWRLRRANPSVIEENPCEV